MGQRDLLLVLAQIWYVHGAKRPATSSGSNTLSIWGKETYCEWGSNTVSVWGKETYHWSCRKYGMYMGQRDLLLVLAQIRYVHVAKRPTSGAGLCAVST